jgi:hypothetical protein
MTKQFNLQKISQFFLVKIFIGIAVVGGLVAFTEWAGKLLLENFHISDESKNIIIAISDATIALFSYIFLFSIYEKRLINELSFSSFCKNAIIGFATGLSLQALFILVLFISGNYSIAVINPCRYLLPSFAMSLTAGFVSEILIRGIIFRIIEEISGTVIALLIITLLFAVLHLNVAGATLISVMTTAMQAGLVLSAAYVFTRSLWFTIFLHFAWDFAEPGIFGAINPGNSIQQSLFTSKISGTLLLTGGKLGPQNSIQALIFCSITALLFLFLAKKNNKFIKPHSRN